MADTRRINENSVLARDGYVSLEEVFSDRRDPHANPLSSSPRRSIPRMNGKGASAYLKDLYRPTVGD